MRDLVLYELMSLDGVAEEPGNWLFDAGAELVDNLARIIERQDDVILGRGTYDYWSAYWPTADVEPFATFINSTPKHVATSTPLEPAWANSTAITVPLVEHVRALKATGGGDIGVHGSIGVARALLAAGLVDVIHLVVAPTLAGSGTTLWGGMDAVVPLVLERTAADPHGNVFLSYRRAAVTT